MIVSVATAWELTDLAGIVAAVERGETVGPVPALLRRSDGVALLYPGQVHSIAGEPEAGKSWIAQAESARLIEAGERVLYLDFEDGATSIVGRLLALGASEAAIVERFAYVHPEGTPNAEVIEELLADGPFALAVIDGVSEAYQLCGLDPNANHDAAQFLATIARPLAERGAAVVQIDHVTKDRETRGRWAIGAQHKLAGIACAYRVQTITAPSRSSAGLLKVQVVKDRHGHIRGHAQGSEIALVRITPADDGTRVTVTIDPPDGTAGDAFRPTVLMERASRFLAENPGASVNEIRKGVQGKNDFKDVAVRTLIAEGYVERRAEGQARRHYNLRDYHADADEDTTVPPCPDRALTGPGYASTDRAPVPHPLTGGQGLGSEGDTATAPLSQSLTPDLQRRLDYERFGDGGR